MRVLAGTPKQELSEDSRTREVPTALLLVSETDNGLDALSEEAEDSEEESSHGDSEDSTSEVPES